MNFPQDYQLFIEGNWVTGGAGTFDRHNPANNELAVRLSKATRADAERAVAAARRSFESGVWSRIDSVERQAVLLKLADLLIENRERLAWLESETTGSPIRYARNFIDSSARFFRYYAGLARDIYGRAYQFGDSKAGFTLKEPIGVASLIMPWNFPLGELAWKLAPALAAGCSVVAKPDLNTAATTLEMGPLLKAAGLPDGVFNVIVGDVAEVGEVLTQHTDIDAVSFTGSTGSGSAVMQSAAASVTPVHLELGGKSPLIVLEDADLEQAAADAAGGIFWHNGQVCTACSRLLVQESVADEFIERLQAAAAAMKLGDPRVESTELGSLISIEHRDRVAAFIDSAIDEGATVALDGRDLEGLEVVDKRAYLGPTILTDVQPDMQVAREEVFGPVASVIRVRDLDDAIAIANDSRYGLGAGIWTGSMAHAFRAIKEIRSGSVWVNGYGADRTELPWGGCKSSGFGRELGHEALELFINIKSVHISNL